MPMLPDWPTQRLEAFKYTSLKGLAGLTLPEGVAELTTSALPAGVTLTQGDVAIEGLPENGVVARAQSHRHGWVLEIAAGTVVREPIELRFSSDAVACLPKLVVRIGSRVEVTLVEIVAHGGLANSLSSFEIADGANVRHLRLQHSAANASHLDTRVITLGRGARYNHFSLVTHCGLSRYEPHVRLAGEGAETSITAVHLLSNAMLADLTSVITHAVPHTTSREVVKTVLRDEARGVFQGRIIVAPDAQKTNGHQLSRALLLSPRAEMDTKPELEIFADDVKCSHGAATGALDETALFYLKSRGVSDSEARALLIEAFIAEAVNELPEGALRTRVEGEVAAWLR